MINPDSKCATCANCIIRPDGDLDFLCSEDCMESRLSCTRYAPRETPVEGPDPESRIISMETAIDGVATDQVTIEMIVDGKTRDGWYDFISHRSGSFVLEDMRYRLTLERKGAIE